MRRAPALALLLLVLLPAAAGAAGWARPQALTHGGLAGEPQAALGGGAAAGVVYTRRYAGSSRVAARTVSGRDEAVPAPPSFAMTSSGRALIAYATRDAEIHRVTRAGGP